MKTEITNKRIDNKYALWGYTVDPTCAEDIEEMVNAGVTPVYIPQRWIMLGVFDEFSEAQEKQKTYSYK